VLAARGRALLTAAGLWLGIGTVATLMIGIVLSGTLVAPLETVMGAGAAGIVILIRARRPEAASAAAVNAD
jgi:DNA-binding transcriptional LysR family regulator